MAINKTLQKLILANNALKLATGVEYKLLGDALKDSPSMLMIDLSDNAYFDDNLEFHEAITEPIVNSTNLKLRKIIITTKSVDIKAHYLSMYDH